jgi:glycosyl transferase family 2
MQATPIAVFTYNRPEHTRRMLASLAKCSRLTECRLHLFCDGARTLSQQPGVDATRKVAAEFAQRLGGQMVVRDENLGLARSIVTGVTALVQEFGRAVVIEDDLILSPDYLDFMLQALDRYQAEDEVYQISGYLFPIDALPNVDSFFLPLTTTWGWATWARAWQRFEWAPKHAHEMLRQTAERLRFDLDGSYPYSSMLQDRLAGKNDSWGILWWHAVFMAAGKVLYPRRSLVSNKGFDGTGTHSGNNPALARTLHTEVKGARIARPLKFPASVNIDPIAWSKVKEYLRQQQATQSDRSHRQVWQKLKRLMKR